MLEAARTSDQLTMRNLDITDTHAKLGIYAQLGMLSLGEHGDFLRLRDAHSSQFKRCQRNGGRITVRIANVSSDPFIAW